MAAEIHSLDVGFTNCFIIKGEGVILVGGGAPGQRKAFIRAMEEIAMDPREIRLIVITHGHFDHYYSGSEFQELTGAPIAMHRRDKERVDEGSKLIPGGLSPWGGLVSALLRLMAPFLRMKSLDVEVIIGDEGLSLRGYGVPGRIIHTPGHTEGSVSVLLDSGEAFVGDLAMNGLPLRLGPGLPVLGYDIERVKESWRTLLKEGAETVYPSHGKPFPAYVIREALGMN
jgi:glyoxylase-like metal-dependent hydrolase (beta-lactamase superfamily II)